jgi:hypothetical protein
MQSFQTNGTFKIENNLTLINPLLSIEIISYNLINNQATIVVLMEGTNYSHSRELPLIDFTSPLTNAEIKSAVQTEFAKLKQL